MKVLGIDGGNVPGFCKRRQVARREEVDAGDAQCRAQLRRLGQMDEQVEVVAHEAIRQNLDAGKLRHAPQPLDEARTLLVSQVERAVRDPTDQVTTTIRLEIAQSSHAAHESIFRNYSTTPTPPLVCRVGRDAPAGYVRPLIEPYVQFSRIRLTVWNL